MMYLGEILLITGAAYLAGMALVVILFLLGWSVYKLIAVLQDVPLVVFAPVSIIVSFLLIDGVDFFLLPNYWFEYWFTFALALGLGGVLTSVRWWWGRQSVSSLNASLSGIRMDGQRRMDDLSDALIRDVLKVIGRE